MALDMRGAHQHNPAVHYRRYLDDQDRIVVIRVQASGYSDYDPARFLDHAAYTTEAEAQTAPFRPGDATRQYRRHGSPEAYHQAMRLLTAMRHHDGLIPAL